MCNPVGALAGKNVDTVVCFGIGEGAIRNLERNGIKVYKTDKSLISDILTDSKVNNFSTFESGHTCSSHEHHHNAGCSH
jgi:predicted Fe-Mo cluster-binding NifX family protein